MATVYNNAPNFSIIAPGKCNGKCGFCFWKQIDIAPNYLNKLREHIADLPSIFRQVSITGGEPTISKQFKGIIKIVGESITDGKINKVVLTTNGTQLEKNLVEIKGVVNHINISRHHYNDGVNYKIFGATSVPNSNNLCRVIELSNKLGIDVTLNCVLPVVCHKDCKEFVFKFVEFAKGVGAIALSFRRQHGSLNPHDFENQFKDYAVIEHNECPVCRSKMQLIKGLKVYWKSSVIEPNDKLKKDVVYELVAHPNGVLTSDWEGKKEIISDGKRLYTNEEFTEAAKKVLSKISDDYVRAPSCGFSAGVCGVASGC